MKAQALLQFLSFAAAAVPPRPALGEETFLVQLENEQKWVTQEEKRNLRLEGTGFIDKTYSSNLGAASLTSAAKKYAYPSAASHSADVKPLFGSLSTDLMKSRLTTFSTFQNRYYKGGYGAQSSAWLLDIVNTTLVEAGVTSSLGATVEAFAHPKWNQDSIIDSVNWKASNQQTSRAPGADDNGSGSMTILEALRVYLTSPEVLAGEAVNTVEFHWYSAEEAGLLGSQAVFDAYAAEGRDVAAMLEQDMTGYSAGMQTETLGVVTDYVNKELTEFIKMIVDTYCDIPYTETKYCMTDNLTLSSDFASATEAGYQSAFVIEAPFEKTSPYIHTDGDTLATVNYNHMKQHGQMTLGFVYELAFTAF
ncbi:hypothetical protein KVR01_005322 [Diaporthe batatas]|uniref:uncharacterized protein n=1 Tax=Diaporthe batatas TaxID=748121 RepID=UPI001D041258|nr:uncharacterized protein KVR01_005322 [Diaporthe batatas]KAG8165047.1 hypothetical protein KVR01_005322 [Diaporthe batatas]